MLQLIFHILLISSFCIIWGFPVLFFQKTKFNEHGLFLNCPFGSLISLFLSGLLLLSIISGWACLFFPINFPLLLFITTGLLIFLLLFRRKNTFLILNEIKLVPHLSFLEFSFISISILLFIILGSLKTINSDTHIYHTQIIFWLNEYGTVPGIANLFPRLGLGSNWLNLISLFRLPFLDHENFTYLNTTLVIWFFLWLFNKWRWYSKCFQMHFANKFLSLFYLLLILFCLFDWELFRDTANSTNYDFIVTALTIIVVSYLLESILFYSSFGQFSILFIIFCLSIISFKLSGIFILLLLIVYLISHYKIINWVQIFCIGLIILLPLFIKNYITSGHPFFPISWSPFSPDWQLPDSMTNYLRQYILVTNRNYNDYEIDFTRIPELINNSWILKWFNGILLIHKFIILASISSFSIFFLKSKFQFNLKKLKLLFALLIIMAAGWFFSAPSPRFGYGVLLIMALFPLCFFIGYRLPLLFQKIMVFLVIFVSAIYIFKIISPINNNRNYLIHPVESESHLVKLINIKGIDFYLPDSINNDWKKYCDNTHLPCICQQNKYLEPIGKTLKEGFRMNQKPDTTFIRNYIY